MIDALDIVDLLENSVSVTDIINMEIDVLIASQWDLPTLMCPLEIIYNLAGVLELTSIGFVPIKAFSEDITDFVMWSTWNRFSSFSIAAATMVIYCEILGANDNIVKITRFTQQISGQLNARLLEEVRDARFYILSNLPRVCDDPHLIAESQRILNANPLGI